MRDYLVFAVCVALTFSRTCIGEEYLLKIEEVDGPVPAIEGPEFGPPSKVGWLRAADADSKPIRIGRSIELLVSTGSQFHVRVNDRDERFELNGEMSKSTGVYTVTPKALARQPAGRQHPEPQIVGEQGQDFIVQVDYGWVLKNDRRAAMRVAIPLRFGKTFCQGGGPDIIPPTLWSLEKVAAKPTE